MALRGNTVRDIGSNVTPPSVMNNFVAGLKTEYTGLNFPPNAATDTLNCVYSTIGNVVRRDGYNYESNYTLNTIDRNNKAIATYKWFNAGGDGDTQILVMQVGNALYFFKSSDATVAHPLSSKLLSSVITVNSFLPTGSSKDPSQIECQFADGNGFLFVYHPYLNPFYCTFVNDVITPTRIDVKIRDLKGIPEPGVPIDFRPTTLTDVHSYNLQNQGWAGFPSTTSVQGTDLAWSTTSIHNHYALTHSDYSHLTGVGTNTITIPTGSYTTAVGTNILNLFNDWSKIRVNDVLRFTLTLNANLSDGTTNTQAGSGIATVTSVTPPVPLNPPIGTPYTTLPSITVNITTASAPMVFPGNVTSFYDIAFENNGWFFETIPLLTLSDSRITLALGTHIFVIPSGLTSISAGTAVVLNANAFIYNTNGTDSRSPIFTGGGIVTNYSGVYLTVNVTSMNAIDYAGTGFIPYGNGVTTETWSIGSANALNLINIFLTQIGRYPSNSDVWWTFKDVDGIFNPATTIATVTNSASPAPKGHFILNAFDQQRDTISGITSLTDVTTTLRPSVGTWFQGRVWYAGVNASQNAIAEEPYYTWTENLYFSRIIEDASQFGLCLQENDPTDEKLFDLLPDDGGVITIQGCGDIFKLWPIQNGMLVFAANGVWYITGSTGIGFTATDYTITKVSSIRTISPYSFVDVNGYPVFWNEEGIFSMEPAQQATQQVGFSVNSLIIGNILSYFQDIPRDSKTYVRGVFDPVNNYLQWIFRSTPETNVTDRYQYDTVLTLNLFTKSFYPYTISTQSGWPKINGIVYIVSPGGSSAPPPVVKYIVSSNLGQTYSFTFAEERDSSLVDWKSFDGIGLSYNSHFVTGYVIDGQGQRRFQPLYIHMYSNNDFPTSYSILGVWDYALDRSTGRFSTKQVVVNNKPNRGVLLRRHRIRGHGFVFQYKIESVGNSPFDIIGWSTWSTQNESV